MPSPTEPGVVLGTVGYMAPEQVRGLAVDHRADLFAFGAILYELLSGRRAFRRDTAAETMAAILNEDPPDLRATERPIPPALARIVDRCLEKSPSARFQTASDLAFALEAACRTRRARQQPRASPHLGTQAWLGWGAAALLLATLAPLAYRARPRAARRAQPDALPDFPDRRIRRGREISACLRTAVTWRSWGSARMGSRGSGSGPWIRWKSGPFPVRRPSASRRLRFGLRTDGSSRSMPAADSRSWM